MQTRRWALPLTLLLSLVIPGVGATDESEKIADVQGPLVKTLRASMNSFRNMPPPGYVADGFCVSGDDEGAVGIHFVNLDLAFDGILDPANPEVLYYEPLSRGRIRLAGAEYVYVDPAFGPALGPMNDITQNVGGHLLHYMEAPNRFGIGVDWLRLNVWAWRRNPNGTFASDNPRVSCDRYDPILHAPSNFGS